MRKEHDDWTTIAIRKDTRSRLEKLKVANFDDVIRKGMDMPPIEEKESGESA